MLRSYRVRDLGISGQTLHNWWRHERMDRLEEAGLTTGKRSGLSSEVPDLTLETEFLVDRARPIS